MKDVLVYLLANLSEADICAAMRRWALRAVASGHYCIIKRQPKTDS